MLTYLFISIFLLDSIFYSSSSNSPGFQLLPEVVQSSVLGTQLWLYTHTPHQHPPNTAILIPTLLERKEEMVPPQLFHGILTACWKTISN